MLRNLTLLGLGAGLMYYLDPEKGRRRRALVRDQIDRLGHDLSDATGKGWRDLSNRTRGLAHEAGSMFEGDCAPDAVVVARVRAALGHVVSHPKAIAVTCRQGRVGLSGPILSDEVDDLIAAVAHVRGVQSVEDRLEPHGWPNDVPALQGGKTVRGPSAATGTNWAPGTRLLAGATGGALIVSGLARGGLSGLLASLAGGALLTRSLGDFRFAGLPGAAEGNRSFEPRRPMDVGAAAR